MSNNSFDHTNKQLSVTQTLTHAKSETEMFSDEANNLDLTSYDSTDTIESSELDNIFISVNTINNRKQQILEHIRQSNHSFPYAATNNNQRNQQIREHLKKSLS